MFRMEIKVDKAPRPILRKEENKNSKNLILENASILKQWSIKWYYSQSVKGGQRRMQEIIASETKGSSIS